MSRSQANRRGKQPPAGEPVKPDAEPLPSSGGSFRWWVLVVGILAISAAGIYRYRVGQNPMLRMPQLDLQDVTPSVAETISRAHQDVVQHPRSSQAWGNLGIALLTHEFREPATQCFAEAERLDDDEVQWPYYRGMSLADSDPEAALTAFERAAELAPKHSAVLLRLAEWLFGLGRLDESRAHYETVLQAEPDNPRAQSGMARVLLGKNELPQSRTWAERAVASQPGRRDVRELLARVYSRLGETELAQQQAERLRDLKVTLEVWHDPFMLKAAEVRRDVAYLALQAAQLAATRNYAASVRIYQQLVALQPENPLWKHEMAKVFWDGGQPDEAATVLDRAIGVHSDAAELIVLRGRIDLAQGRTKMAADRFRSATRVKPDFEEAFFRLGVALQELEAHDEAVEAFRQVTTLRPNQAIAYERAARSLQELGRRDAAIDQLRLALRHDDDNVPALELLAELLTEAGETGQAQEVRQRLQAAKATLEKK